MEKIRVTTSTVSPILPIIPDQTVSEDPFGEPLPSTSKTSDNARTPIYTTAVPGVHLANTTAGSSLLKTNNTWNIPKTISQKRRSNGELVESTNNQRYVKSLLPDELRYARVPQTGAKERAAKDRQILKELCDRDGILDPCDFTERIHTNEEYKNLYKKMHNSFWEKNLKAACSYARTLYPMKNMLDLLPPVSEVKLDGHEAELLRYFLENFIWYELTEEKFVSLVQLMSNRYKYRKVKTILMVGEANAGKSRLLELLTAPWPYSFIGKADPQSNKSEFWLQSLRGKRVYVLEELIITKINKEIVKLLFEGSTNLTTSVKHEDAERLLPQPVIVTTNSEPWIDFPQEESPLRARCIYLDFNTHKGCKDINTCKHAGLDRPELFGTYEKSEYLRVLSVLYEVALTQKWKVVLEQCS